MMSERDIARGCKRGNAIAQRELFDRYSPHLMAVIFRYVGDDDDAKDVLQDTFIKIYTTIDKFSYSGEGSLWAWITRVAVNRSLNFLRDKKRIKTISMPLESMADPPDDEDEETARQVNSLDISTLMELVAELPDGYRTVFNMHCIDGFSHQEIANQLGISVNSSTSQLVRAKALLARKIKQHINKQELQAHYEQ